MIQEPKSRKLAGWRGLPTLHIRRGEPLSAPADAPDMQVAYNVQSLETIVRELENRKSELFRNRRDKQAS